MAKLVGQLLSSEKLKEKLQLSEKAKETIIKGNLELRDVFSGKSDKKVLVIGPCSADFEESLYEYANFLSNISKKVQDKIKIVMRFYTGKPRTIGGWKGLQNSRPGENPDLASGIENTRRIAINIIEKYGLILADEMLHPQIINYIDDIYSYLAIGARSTENQYHREVASGLDIPIGVKNGTSGDTEIMLNGVLAVNTPSVYVVGKDIYETTGNKYSHGVLRGGDSGPNYSLENIEKVYEKFNSKGLTSSGIIVDCNHANSGKKPEKQIEIMKEVLESISSPHLTSPSKERNLKDFVKGFMVESYLYDGRQDYSENCQKGLSLTDPCVGREGTEKLVMEMYDKLKVTRK